MNINTDFRVQALLDALKKEYPISTNGLTLYMLHNVLNKHNLLVAINNFIAQNFTDKEILINPKSAKFITNIKNKLKLVVNNK